MIFQIYDLLAPLVAKASTDRYGEGKAETRNVNVENCLPTKRQVTEKAVNNPFTSPLQTAYLRHFHPYNAASYRPISQWL